MQQKKFSINISKANTKLYLSLNCNGDESYLYLNKTKIYKFKLKENIIWYNFSLRRVSKAFTKDELSELSFNGTEYDFQLNIVQLKKKAILIFTNI